MVSPSSTRRRVLQAASVLQASSVSRLPSLVRIPASVTGRSASQSIFGLGVAAAEGSAFNEAHASEPSPRSVPSLPSRVRRLSFKTSDGLRLSFLDSGSPGGGLRPRDPGLNDTPSESPALVLIPGWLMPAEVFLHQLSEFTRDHRVVVLDPRSQGQSALHASTPSERLARDRARDIHELIEHLGLGDLVLIGWSLGVLECLDCIRLHGVKRLRGLVLIDNSVGEGPAPPARSSRRPKTTAEFDAYIEGFVQAMIRHREDEPIAHAVRQSALRLRRTPARAFEILGKPWPRETYRDAVYEVRQPVWYAITPRYREQGERLTEYHPRVSVTLYEDATHAIFIDQPVRFNADLRAFLESVY